MNTKVTIAGVEWNNPVTVASGTFGSGAEFTDFVDLNRLGAVTTKGVANVPWTGNPTPRVAETYGGMMNAVGLQNPGIDVFCERDIPFLRKYDTKIIVNVCGRSTEDYCEVVERLANEDVDMLEINISCPNVKEGGIAFGQNPNAAEEITKAVKKYAKQPIIMKLSPNVTSISEMAKAVEAGGADAVSLINTLTGMKIDVNKKAFVLANKTGVEGLNRTGILPKRLRITNMEAPLTEEQVKVHFALIDTHTSAIVEDEKNASKRFARAIDFYLVQDFSSAVSDLTQTILLDGDFFPAYFMRALIRCKQLEYQKAEQAVETDVVPGDNKRKEITAVDYEVVRKDLDKVINLAPDFVYAYYNRANVSAMLKDYRAAIVDYDKAIELNPDFADAYFNRGLTHIFLGNNKLGISDLSKAGELGIVSAYNVIKRFTDQSE